MALSHESLMNYYQTNYQLMQNHQYSLDNIENMIPWEREIYLEMLLQQLKDEREQNAKNQMQG
tara:strand:+ start:1917 stop:2105 length:189 start_codon:yes stop_codon:yes gene_type:complete